MAVFVNISLDPKGDRDILDWLDEQPNRSAAVRAAIRGYMAKEGITLADVLAEIRALPSRFSVVAMSSEAATPEREEPETAAANLDGLLSRLGKGDLG